MLRKKIVACAVLLLLPAAFSAIHFYDSRQPVGAAQSVLWAGSHQDGSGNETAETKETVRSAFAAQKEGKWANAMAADERFYSLAEAKQEEEELARAREEERIRLQMAGEENARQQYPLLTQPEADADPGDYIRLFASGKNVYQVRNSDTLWGLAKRFYGQGTAWEALQKENAELLGDGTVLLPGMELSVPESYYIEKQSNSRGGFSSPACQYDVPYSWVYGSTGLEACLDVYWSEYQEVKVYNHITRNRMFPTGAGSGWEEMQQQIREAAHKAEGVSFSEPVFSRYRLEAGPELLFYSFICEAGKERIQYAVAYVLGDLYLAEFIGCCPLDAEGMDPVPAITDITRYMAASFVENGEEKNWASLKYRPYLGHESWPWEDLHNPFALAAAEYAPQTEPALTGPDRELTFVSAEWEALLRRMTASHYRFSEEQFAELADRPLKASDLAWITEVTLVESPIPGRDTVAVNGLSPREPCLADYNLTTFQDLAALPNLQKLTLEIGGLEDYEVLAGCPKLEALSIASESRFTDVEWLAGLPSLKSLTLHISMFARLNEMGYQKEEPSTFQRNGEQEKAADGLADTADGRAGTADGRTDTADGLSTGTGSDGKANQQTAGSRSLEEILSACTSLEYLDLEVPGELDFGFLEKLPCLYTFRLSGEEEESRNAAKRRAYFTEDICPQIRCLTIDDNWLRNPE